MRLAKAIERVSCAHCQRDPQSCTTCLKCAPSNRKRRPTPPHLKWRFLLASCRWACNLRWSTRPLLHSTRVIAPRVLIHGLRNRAISNKHWRPCMCKLGKTAHRHGSWMLVSRHHSLSDARRRHPTAQTVHCNARKKTSVHQNLFHWCHEIHLKDLPNLAHASALSCHEQFHFDFELVSVLLHQTFLVAVAL